MRYGFDALSSAEQDLLPGICDFHVHCGERIGGYILRDGFADMNAMAAKAGIAALGCFVTEEAGQGLTDKLRAMQRAAARDFHGHVHWHLTPVHAGVEELAPLFAEGCDIKLYTTYRNAGIYTPYERVERWMRDLADIKTRMLVHCEDDAIVAEHSAKHPFRAPFAHTLRRPEAAEIHAVEVVLELAVKHAYPVHIVHVSTPKAALMIHSARQHNPLITCETAPHYLLYNETLLKAENAHRWLCSPPFRSESSQGMLVELLQDGCFDIIATDHCAFRSEDKDRHRAEPEKVPNGIPGLPMMFPSLYKALVETGKLSLEDLVNYTCVNPAKLMSVEPKREHTLAKLLGNEDRI